MRSAKDFNKKDDSSSVDHFIEKEIFTKLDDDNNNGSVVLYMNVIHMDGVNLKQLKNRLKELGFSTNTSKEGVDDVLNINVK